MIEVDVKQFSAPNNASNPKYGRASGNRNWSSNTRFWEPPTDLYETPETFVVVVEIAGMRESEFVISLEKRMLVISGERMQQQSRGGAYHQLEILSGEFVTVVELPSPVQYDEVSADYEDGFLTITLPKTQIVQVDVKNKRE